MKITLRPAQPAEQSIIRQMVRKAHLNPMGLDWSHFLVAEAAGEIVGIGQIKPHGDGSRELASLVVRPDTQGQGVGGAIIRALQEKAESPLYLMCRADLAPYYERFGFAMLALAEMPPYFRRIARLMNLFAPSDNPRLAVMKWTG
ncbi:GNAT family N-acetyltransferase [Chloroflexota bacterium]